MHVDPNNRPSGLDHPIVPKVLKYLGKANVAAYRATGGRIGGKWRVGSAFPRGVPVLLLDHRGRKSNKLYTTPLLYLRDGENIIVVASQGGLPRDPQWFRNLVTEPETAVQVGKERFDVVAHVATAAERADVWPKLVAMYSDFDAYQAWTDREIPVVILTPRS